MNSIALAILMWFPLTGGAVNMADPTMVKEFKSDTECVIDAELRNRGTVDAFKVPGKTQQEATKQVWLCFVPKYPT